VIIMILPVFGEVLYLLWGRPPISRSGRGHEIFAPPHA